jgi:hypothetical protein
MKKIIITALIFLGINGCTTAQFVIGKIEDDRTILTYDKEKLLTAFNANLLKESGIDAKFTEVNIVEIGDKGYFLVFRGSEYKSAFTVTRNENQLITTGTITCTTSDCSNESFGCIPNWTSCTLCENKGKCTKTISSNNLLISAN